MRKRLTNKRVVVGLTTVALAVLGAVTALAFFTGGGTGSGSATIASDSAVTVENVTLGSQVWPGHGTPVTFDVKNLSPSVPLSVGSVIADASYGGAASNGVDSLPTGCTGGDFSFAPVPVTTELTHGATVVETGTLTMADATTNQDACKNGTPTLHLVVKNP